jgi:hypothetical protein
MTAMTMATMTTLQHSCRVIMRSIQSLNARTRETLEIISFFILCIFCTENCILLAILGIRTFFSHPMYCIDFCIVFMSMIFDVTSLFILNDNKDNEDDDLLYDDIIQFIIIGRLWRFVGLSYDLMMIEKETEQEQDDDNDECIENLKEKITELEKQLLLIHHNDNNDDAGTTTVVNSRGMISKQSKHDNISNSSSSSSSDSNGNNTDYHQLT